MGMEITNEAIQVFGGYGYTRDQGIEQLYRDNRITPIYEGTNSVQAIDLVFRKILNNNIYDNYIAQITKEIQEYEKNISDGVYHLYVLNADNSITEEYTTQSFSQNVDDLYPQLDRDNIQDNPAASKTFGCGISRSSHS